MPTRDYYLEKEFSRMREAYVEMAVNLSVLVGAPREKASVHAGEMLRFETRLAEVRRGGGGQGASRRVILLKFQF